MSPNTHRAFPLLFAALAMMLAPGGAAGGGRVTGAADLGFDSFQERYSIVDSDTLDSIHEFRSRLALGYVRGSLIDDFLQVDARALIGEDGSDYTAALTLIERFAANAGRFGLSADVSRRDYREDSSYEFANDYTRYYLRGYTRWSMATWAAVRFTERLEALDYQRRTEFDYDYIRNRLELDVELERDLTSSVTAGVSFTSMSIPDSTDIEYESWTPILEVHLTPAPYRRLNLYADLERRLYAHEPTRSSFWALVSTVAAELPLAGPISAEGTSEVERYAYDEPDDVYFDFVRARNALLARYNWSWSLHVGAGPTYGVFRSDDSPGDEYDEYGGKLTLDYLRGSRLWLAVSYERGRRDYEIYDPDRTTSLDVDAIYSDYDYDRLSLIATARVWDGVSLNALLDYQPEDHEREGDDATATLFSISLTYSF